MSFLLISVHLHAKDVTIREEAILCFENLAQQCSDWMAIKEIIEQLFDVLNGKLFEVINSLTNY